LAQPFVYLGTPSHRLRPQLVNAAPLPAVLDHKGYRSVVDGVAVSAHADDMVADVMMWSPL
jgi:hypothetical protein